MIGNIDRLTAFSFPPIFLFYEKETEFVEKRNNNVVSLW